MGNFGTGFAAFANGLASGVQIGDGLYQRKLDRERQKKIDEYLAQEQERAGERFNWDRTNQQQLQEQRGMLLDDARRQRADQSRLRDAWGQSVDATEGAMGALPQPPTSDEGQPAVPGALGAMPPAADNPQGIALPDIGAVRRAAAGSPARDPQAATGTTGGTGNAIPIPPQRPNDIASSASNKPAGMIAPGNIDLGNRPVVRNNDGTISTVRSISIGEDGREVLIPTVSNDGRIMSDDEAVATYRRTGQNLGTFDSPASATAYAQTLHEQQAATYAAPPVPQPDPRRASGQQPALGAVPEQAASPLFAKAAGGRFEARAPTTREEAIAVLKAARDGMLTPEQTAKAGEYEKAALAKGQLTPDEQKYLSGPRFVEGPGGALLDPQGSFSGANPNGRPYQWGQPGGLANDARRAAGAVGSTVADIASRTAEAAVNQGADIVAGVNAPFRAASIYATGTDHVGAPDRVDLNGDGTRQSVVSPFIDAIPTNKNAPAAPPSQAAAAPLGAVPLPPNATPAEARVAAGAVAAMNTVGDQPDMKAAADATPLSAMGAKPGQPMTKPQVEAGAKTFMDSWRKNGAPIIQRELIRQGKINEAQQLEQWIKSDQAQAGMNAWAKGAFMAMTGDVEGSLDALSDAFNATGYYDDGFEIVKDKSEIMRDERGDPAGVRIVFRNQQTGEESEREMRSDDFAQMALLATAPQEAFKASIERQRALQERLLKADDERRAAATDLVKSNYAAITKAATEIYKSSIGLDGKPTKTYEEALAEAQAAFGGEGGASASPQADVPVLRRAQ